MEETNEMEKGFLRETKMSRTKIIGTIAAFFLGQLVFGGFMAIFFIYGLGMEELSASSWLNFSVFGFLSLVFLGMHGKQFAHDWKRKGPMGKFIGQVLIGWAGLFAFSFVANVIIMVLLGVEEGPANQYYIENMAFAYPILVIIMTVVFAPFVEEVVFRLAFMKGLERWPWVGILGSSFIFGLMHVIFTGDFIFLISYMAMGIPLGYSYYKTGNIWYPTAIHFLQNLYAIGMVLLLSAIGFY